MKLTIHLLVIALTFFVTVADAAPAPYCLALRGNGQLEPAHWGALASLVERMGLPKAQSGGSSATISMFMLDSIASNTWVKKGKDEQEQAERAAFLIKLLPGFSNFLLHTDDGQAGVSVIQELTKIKKTLSADGDLRGLWAIAHSTNLAKLLKAERSVRLLIHDIQSFGGGMVQRYVDLATDTERILTGREWPSPSVIKRMRFDANDLYASVKNAGGFDASDPDLFFRDGVINFTDLAMQVGRAGTFLAGTNWEASSIQAKFESFAGHCEPNHVGKTWKEIVDSNKNCQTDLDDILKIYFDQDKQTRKTNLVLGQLGANIPTFPTVAVILNQDYKDANAAYNKYHNELDKSAALNFKIKDISNVKFGYWGNPEALKQIQSNLSTQFHDDEKSSRFQPLGNPNWIDIMKVSPAEPGLASFQEIEVPVPGQKNEPAYAAGGWSDLHPVLVLRAFTPACENVIYVTRRGGESLFAQGIAKRLLNFDRDWSKLKSTTPAQALASKKINVFGDSSDMDSLWSHLFNVANPKSSFMTALSNADAVVCTDWDSFKVQNDFNKLINEAYHAPFLVNPKSTELAQALKESDANILQETQFRDLRDDGTPKWVGCHGP